MIVVVALVSLPLAAHLRELQQRVRDAGVVRIGADFHAGITLFAAAQRARGVRPGGFDAATGLAMAVSGWPTGPAGAIREPGDCDRLWRAAFAGAPVPRLWFVHAAANPLDRAAPDPAPLDHAPSDHVTPDHASPALRVRVVNDVADGAGCAFESDPATSADAHGAHFTYRPDVPRERGHRAFVVAPGSAR